MTDAYLPSPGTPIATSALTVPKAKQLADHLSRGIHPWAHLVQATRTDGPDEINTVVFDVEVEVSQVCRNDIRPLERVAVSFSASDQNWPQVVALRSDFPFVPHLYLREQEFPRCLCLYEDSYAEQGMRWTAISLIERVRDWLRDSGAGTLHSDDQPLEPIFLGTRAILILPHDTFSTANSGPVRLGILHHEDQGCGEVFVAVRPTSQPEAQRAPFVALAILCPPVVHGVIRAVPTSLLDLHRFCHIAGLDLFDVLRQRLGEWEGEKAILDRHLLIILGFPKLRREGEDIETTDVWGFVTNDPVARIGEALGLWQMRGDVPGGLLGGVPDENLASNVALMPLNSTFSLSRATAAAANGFQPVSKKITAIGLGALGSQLTATLARAGYGRWTFVDRDLLLPHNVARHELGHGAVGWPKVSTMQIAANSILAEPCVEGAIVADVLAPGANTDSVAKTFADAEAIVDCSASVAVSRHLAADISSKARRVSAFLNPRGCDLVVLTEDTDRSIALDCLEMQYYRQVLDNPALADHLKPPDGRLRYARSCRDVSSTLSQDQVALHAAIGARAVRRALVTDEAAVDIWTSAPDLSTRHVHITPATAQRLRVGEYEVVTDAAFTGIVRKLREEKLPRETGGVLLGCWDFLRKRLYVVHTIPSPPDSKERQCLYIRGVAGLAQAVNEAETRTGRMLQYIGEWHSHPDGFAATPSKDDLNVWGWIAEKTTEDGYPPVMLIVGEHDLSWFVGVIAKYAAEMRSEEERLQRTP